jgi:dTDP-4-dehydrorhamnose 3,5-epimerase
VLSADNWRQLWVPAGFAHGYCTLEDDTEVQYKVTDYYSLPHERGIAWSDPELMITWPVAAEAAIVSERDRQLPRLAEQPDLSEYGI